MPFALPAGWKSVVERASDVRDSAAETAARRSPFPVVRAALTLVLPAIFVAVFPAAAAGSSAAGYFAVNGNLARQLEAIPRAWMDAAEIPVDDASAEWAAIAVLLLTMLIVALFVVASFALLTTGVFQMALCLVLSIIIAILIHVELLGGGTDLVLPTGQGCVLRSSTVSGIFQLSLLTSFIALEALALHPNQSPNAGRVCKTTIIRALGIIGQVGCIAALLGRAMVPSLLSRFSVGTGMIPAVHIAMNVLVFSGAVIALTQEIRSCRQAVASGAASHQLALRIANLTALATTLLSPLASLFITLTASASPEACPAYLVDGTVSLPSGQSWPFGCLTIGCFPSIRASVSSRGATLWVAALTYVALSLVVILASQADVASVRENDARNAASNMRHALQYISHEARAPLGGAILSLGLLDSAVLQFDFSKANLLISDLNLSLEAAQRQLTDLLLFDSDLGDVKAASVARWSPLEGPHLHRLQASFAGACQAEGIQLEIATTTAISRFPPEFSVLDYWARGVPLSRMLEEALSASTSGTPRSRAAAARAGQTGAKQEQPPRARLASASKSASSNQADLTAMAGTEAQSTGAKRQAAAQTAVAEPGATDRSGNVHVIATTSNRRRQSHLPTADALVPGPRPPTHSNHAAPALASAPGEPATSGAPAGSKELLAQRDASAAAAIGLEAPHGTGERASGQAVAAARHASTSSDSGKHPGLALQVSRHAKQGASLPVHTPGQPHMSLSPASQQAAPPSGVSVRAGVTGSPELGPASVADASAATEGRATASLAPDTEVYADVDRILAIVTNALSNSIKHVADDGSGKIAVLLSLLPHSAMPGANPAHEPPPEPRVGFGHSGVGSTGGGGGDGTRTSQGTTRRRRQNRGNLGGMRSFFTRGTGSRFSEAQAGTQGQTTAELGQTRGLRSRLSADSADGGAGLTGSKPAIRVLEIQVLDNGRGIPGSVLKRGQFFHPFQQLRHDDASRRMTSTGLGLSIVKSVVVEQLQGDVGLASELGTGTLFFARVPVYARSTVSAGQPSGLPSQAPISTAGADPEAWGAGPSLQSVDPARAGSSPQRIGSGESQASSQGPSGGLVDYQQNSRLHVQASSGGVASGRSSSRPRGSSSVDPLTEDASAATLTSPALRRPNSFQSTQASPKVAGRPRLLGPAPRSGDSAPPPPDTGSLDVRSPGAEGARDAASDREAAISRSAQRSPDQPHHAPSHTVPMDATRPPAKGPIATGRGPPARDESDDGDGLMVVRHPLLEPGQGTRASAAVEVSGSGPAARGGVLQVDTAAGAVGAGGAIDSKDSVKALSPAGPLDPVIHGIAGGMPDSAASAAVPASSAGAARPLRQRPAKGSRDARKAAREARRAQRQADREATSDAAAGSAASLSAASDGAESGSRGAGATGSPGRRRRDALGLAYVVDDERVNRTLMAKLLRGWGFNSVEMVDGTELVAAVKALVDANDTDKSHWPAVITLDIQMPEMDGFMTLTALAELSRGLAQDGKRELSQLISNLVVLGVTGNAVEADRARMSRLGARRVLIKPVVPSFLAESVEEFCPIKLPKRAHKRVGSAK